MRVCCYRRTVLEGKAIQLHCIDQLYLALCASKKCYAYQVAHSAPDLIKSVTL